MGLIWDWLLFLQFFYSVSYINIICCQVQFCIWNTTSTGEICLHWWVAHQIEVDDTLLDFSKDFDHVNHHKLI